jgi:hypothetical protein
MTVHTTLVYICGSVVGRHTFPSLSKKTRTVGTRLPDINYNYISESSLPPFFTTSLIHVTQIILSVIFNDSVNLHCQLQLLHTNRPSSAQYTCSLSSLVSKRTDDATLSAAAGSNTARRPSHDAIARPDPIPRRRPIGRPPPPPPGSHPPSPPPGWPLPRCNRLVLLRPPSPPLEADYPLQAR